jgi:hypothetical protein
MPRAPRLKKLIVLRASLISVMVCFLNLTELTTGTCPHAEAARKAHGLKFEDSAKFDYEAFYKNQLDKKRKDKSYRYFNNINRVFFR